MARNILKSNNSIVIAGQRPAFTTGNRTGSDMSGAYMSAVQSVGVGFSQQRQKSKQVGSKGLAINDITRMPDVDLSISYYYTPAMLNENMLGLINDQTGSSKSDFFSGYDNQDQNFYIVNHQDQGSDMIVNGGSEVGSLTTDAEIISVGNAFLTNYSLGFSVGSLPVVSTSYKCSNIAINQGVFPSFLSISGDVLDATASAISLEPLALGGITDGSPDYSVTTSEGVEIQVNYVTAGQIWELEVDFGGSPPTAIYQSSVTNQLNPNGITLSSTGTIDLGGDIGEVIRTNVTLTSPDLNVENPAINLSSGNNNNVGSTNLEDAFINGFGDYTGVNRFDPPLCSPTKVNSTLQNLQIGGAPISGDAHLQLFSLSIPINRVDLFGLGSDYPYGRKVQYPLTSSVNVEFLVSGLATGEISNLIIAESGYDFDVGIVDTGNDFTHTFSFSDLKLESSSYQMNVNNQMTYSLSFSHEITN